MTDFSTSAELNVTVADSSLKQARSDVESAIADTPVTVEADVGNRPGSAMGSISDSGGLGTDALEKQSSTLGDISSSWEENLQLNERRNELLEDLVDMAEAGQLGGDSGRGRPLGGMGSLLLGGGAALGALGGVLGGQLMNFLKGFNLPKVNIPDIPDINVPDIPPLKAPDIPSLDVPDIPNLGVPNIPELGVPDIPNLGVPDIPDLGIPDNIPDLGVPDIPDLGVPDIPDVGVDVPFPVPIPVASPGSSGGSSGTGSSSPGVLDKTIAAASVPAAQTVNAAEGAANWAGENQGTAIGLGSLALGAGLAASPVPGGRPAGAAVAGAGGGTAILSSLLDGGAGTASATTADESSNTTSSTASTSSSSNRRPNRARETSRQKPEINYSPTINADFSGLERKIDQDLRELERRVSDIEKQLDSLRR